MKRSTQKEQNVQLAVSALAEALKDVAREWGIYASSKIEPSGDFFYDESDNPGKVVDISLGTDGASFPVKFSAFIGRKGPGWGAFWYVYEPAGRMQRAYEGQTSSSSSLNVVINRVVDKYRELLSRRDRIAREAKNLGRLGS